MYTTEDYEKIQQEIRDTIGIAISEQDVTKQQETMRKANELRDKLMQMHNEDEEEKKNILLQLQKDVEQLKHDIAELKKKI